RQPRHGRPRRPRAPRLRRDERRGSDRPLPRAQEDPQPHRDGRPPHPGQELLHEHGRPRGRGRSPGGHLPVRHRPRHLGSRRQLQGPRTRQPVRRRHQLLPQQRRGDPGAHRHGQRDPRGRAPAEPGWHERAQARLRAPSPGARHSYPDREGSRLMSTFPPIADYGFLSNCEQSCLVAPDGAVEWLCLPRPDSPSVFGALLDRAAGLFRFGPGNTHVPQHRRYVPGTMVLETTWQTPTGWMIVQDFLAMGSVRPEGRRPDYHRAPADFGAVGALVRVATCISGRVEVVVNCAPLFDYGRTGGAWSYQGDSYDAMTIAPKEGDVQLELAGSIPLGVLGARCYGRTTLAEGQSAFVALSWGGGNVPASQDEALRALKTTVDFWRDWLSSAKIPDHPWKTYLDRSALTLKGLSYAPTGAIMAASTTSLPETWGGPATGTTASPGSGTQHSCSARCIASASTGKLSSTGALSSTRSAGVTSTAG